MSTITQVEEKLAKLKETDPDVPVFLLIGYDSIAAKTVRDWSAHAMSIGVPGAKVGEAIRCAAAMDEYPQHKVPD